MYLVSLYLISVSFTIMANDSNDKNFKNKLTKELKEKIQKSVRDSFEKNIGEKGRTENAKIRDFEKSAVDNVNEYRNTKGSGSEKARNFAKKRVANERDKYLQKQDALSDFNELRRIDNMSRQASQEKQIRKIRGEIKKEVEKETERASKHVKSAKGKIALKLAGENLDKLAYVLSQKMAEQAKMGGIHAMLAIGMTYLFAFGKDFIDATGVGAILGILTGLIAGTIIAMFWVQVAGGWKGGFIQKRLIKRLIIKTGLAAFIETLPGPNLIPTFIIMNLWSHLDYIKTKKKAKTDLRDFQAEYKTNKMAIKDYYEKYVGN